MPDSGKRRPYRQRSSIPQDEEPTVRTPEDKRQLRRRKAAAAAPEKLAAAPMPTATADEETSATFKQTTVAPITASQQPLQSWKKHGLPAHTTKPIPAHPSWRLIPPCLIPRLHTPFESDAPSNKATVAHRRDLHIRPSPYCYLQCILVSGLTQHKILHFIFNVREGCCFRFYALT